MQSWRRSALLFAAPSPRLSAAAPRNATTTTKPETSATPTAVPPASAPAAAASRKRVRPPPPQPSPATPPQHFPPAPVAPAAPARGSVAGVDAAIAAGTLSALPALFARDLRTVSYGSVLRAMSALLDASHFSVAVAVYDVVVASPSLRSRFTHRVYTSLFCALLKLGRSPHATRAYEEWAALVAEGTDRDLLGPRAYNFIYVLLSRAGMVDEALDVRENCIANGYYLNRYSYNAFLNACAKSYRIADAFETLREMAESNVLPDVVSFNVLISCCVRSGDLDIALGILHRMKDWGIPPDVYSYNSVINGLRKSRMMDDALEIVSQMEADVYEAAGESGLLITDALRAIGYSGENASDFPDSLSEPVHDRQGSKKDTSPLISVLTSARNSAKSGSEHSSPSRSPSSGDESLSQGGLEASQSPSNDNDRVCEKNEAGDDDVSFTSEKPRKHAAPNVKPVSPDLVTYNTLISGIASLDRPDLNVALTIKRHMEERGLWSNEVTYNALMAVAARSQQPDEAFEIYDEMISRSLKPNCECFTTLITLCGRAKMMERAFQMHDHMIASGIEPSVITFNALLTACRCADRQEAGDVALRVLSTMRETEGCTPDVITYSTVIDALGRSGRFSQVRHVLEEMGREGIAPNLVTYTSVISALTRAGDLRGALCVLEDMEKHGIRPNVYTFSTLIHGAGRCGDFDKSFEMMELMRLKGIMASRLTYSKLLHLATKSGVHRHLWRVVEMLSGDPRLRGTDQLEVIEDLCREAEGAILTKRRKICQKMNEAMCECVADSRLRNGDRRQLEWGADP